MALGIWILVGLIAGFISSMLVNRKGAGVLLDIVLGIAGAVIGGWVCRFFGFAGVTGLNLYSLVVAIVGSILLLLVFHVIRRA